MAQKKPSPIEVFPDSEPKAILLALKDPNLIRHVQAGRIAGPDEPDAYRPLLRALGEGFQTRPDADPRAAAVEVQAAPPEDPAWTHDFNAALEHLKKQLGDADTPFSAASEARFRWKMTLIAPGTTSILDLGPRDGAELVFLRALAPGAQIQAIDFQNHVPKERLKATGAELTTAPFERELSKRLGQYDLVFSNHVLEHLHDPDKTLRLIHDSLRPGGEIAAALPLEGLVNGTPTAKALKKGTPAHPLDLHAIAPAHAWKTTPEDLAATLIGAGFDHVRVHYNSRRPATLATLPLDELGRRYRLGRRLNAASFGAARRVLKLIPGESFPRAAARAFASVERRVWFGEPTLTQSVSPEVVVTARRPE